MKWNILKEKACRAADLRWSLVRVLQSLASSIQIDTIKHQDKWRALNQNLCRNCAEVIQVPCLGFDLVLTCSLHGGSGQRQFHSCRPLGAGALNRDDLPDEMLKHRTKHSKRVSPAPRCFRSDVMSLNRWWDRLWFRHSAHWQDPWGVPRPRHEHIQCSKSVRHCCWVPQRHILSRPAGRKRRRGLLHPHPQTQNPPHTSATWSH